MSSDSHDVPGPCSSFDSLDVPGPCSSSDPYHSFQYSSDGHSCSGLGFPSSSCHKSQNNVKHHRLYQHTLTIRYGPLFSWRGEGIKNVLLQTLCTRPSANIFLGHLPNIFCHFLPSLLTTFFHEKEGPFCFHQSSFNLVNSIIYGGDQRIEKREIHKADGNPLITARKRSLLTPLNTCFSFSETYTMMIGGSEKRNRCLNF